MCFKRLVECSCRVRSDNMHSYVGGRVVCTPIVFVALHCQLEVCCWSRQHVVVVRVNIFVVISKWYASSLHILPCVYSLGVSWYIKVALRWDIRVDVSPSSVIDVFLPCSCKGVKPCLIVCNVCNLITCCAHIIHVVLMARVHTVCIPVFPTVPVYYVCVHFQNSNLVTRGENPVQLVMLIHTHIEFSGE